MGQEDITMKNQTARRLAKGFGPAMLVAACLLLSSCIIAPYHHHHDRDHWDHRDGYYETQAPR
jgi:hypothetical protein